MTEEERLELERLRLGGSRNLSEALDVPMPVTNVGLMGEPLREQPSVEQIRFDSRPDRLASKDLATRDRGFFEGIKNIFTDSTGEKLEAERYAPRNQPLDIVPSGNTMRPETPMLDSVMNSGIGPFQPGAVDFSTSATTAPTGEPIELAPLTRAATPPEATFLRADGSIGEIFPGQRIGDAFPGNPDTPSLGGQVQGVDLPGGVGFVRAPEGMVKTIGPDGRMIFATPEQANAMADRINYGGRPSAGGSTAPVAPVAPVTPTSNQGAGQARRNTGRGGINEFPVSDVLDTLKNLDSPGTARGKTSTGVSSDVVSKPPRPSMRRGNTIPQGQPGSIQDNFVKRMATGEPLTQAETAAAIEFARSKGLNFDPRTGYSQAPMATAPQVTGVGSQMMTMEFRDTNNDGIEDRSQGIFRPGDFRGSGANLPTLSSVNAMSGTAPMVTAPQGRPALSAYEQASMDREARIGGTGSFAGDSAAREARIAARDRLPGETQTERDTRIAQSRTQGSNQGGISQADARDLAQGSAKGATEGERMRALQIQSRLGLGAFKPETPRVDKLSQATSTVDRMIQNGQLSPDKRNAAIQKIVGVGSGAAGAGSAGAGVIGSAEFDRVASQLQEGGSLYNMGIRVDPSVVDPLTGAAQIYREKPGLEFGPPERLPVSQELMQQLLPYARSVRQGGTLTQDFTGMGMAVNQFAGSR